MRNTTFTLFLTPTKRLEGVTTWLYPDERELVTTAIGILADPVELALPMPWIHMVTGARATEGGIRAAWSTVGLVCAAASWQPRLSPF